MTEHATWSEPCACGRDIRVPGLPTERSRWSADDWQAIAGAVRLHQGTPEHVAYRLGYHARVVPHTWCPDGRPVIGGLE